MKILVQTGTLRCGHDGTVLNAARQGWVRVGGSAVLVADDPQGRTIVLCPNVGINIKPCTRTLVVQAGYSRFVRIDGHAVCLDTVQGYTDGTPPGSVKYTVRSAGQQLVGAPS